MDSNLTLTGGKMDIVGDNFTVDVGLGTDKKIELNAAVLKTAVTDLEMFFDGGHLATKDGKVDIAGDNIGLIGEETVWIGSLKEDSKVDIVGDNIQLTYKSGFFNGTSTGFAIGSNMEGVFLGYYQDSNGIISIGSRNEHGVSGIVQDTKLGKMSISGDEVNLKGNLNIDSDNIKLKENVIIEGSKTCLNGELKVNGNIIIQQTIRKTPPLEHEGGFPLPPEHEPKYTFKQIDLIAIIDELVKTTEKLKEKVEQLEKQIELP